MSGSVTNENTEFSTDYSVDAFSSRSVAADDENNLTDSVVFIKIDPAYDDEESSTNINSNDSFDHKIDDFELFPKDSKIPETNAEKQRRYRERCRLRKLLMPTTEDEDPVVTEQKKLKQRHENREKQRRYRERLKLLKENGNQPVNIPKKYQLRINRRAEKYRKYRVNMEPKVEQSNLSNISDQYDDPLIFCSSEQNNGLSYVEDGSNFQQKIETNLITEDSSGQPKVDFNITEYLKTMHYDILAEINKTKNDLSCKIDNLKTSAKLESLTQNSLSTQFIQLTEHCKSLNVENKTLKSEVKNLQSRLAKIESQLAISETQ